jgi:hypothetical protein
MKTNILLIVTIVAFVFALVNFSVSFIQLVNLENVLTGMAGTLGYVNLTVEGAIAINFTDESINWSSGAVQSPNTFAWLYSNGTVAGGNWTLENNGFSIENIGTVNVTLTLTAGKSAAEFISGSGPEYKWNMSQVELGSCTNATGTNLSVYFNTTKTATTFCSNFSFVTAADVVRLDIGVKVPETATMGVKIDTITAAATGPAA